MIEQLAIIFVTLMYIQTLILKCLFWLTLFLFVYREDDVHDFWAEENASHKKKADMGEKWYEDPHIHLGSLLGKRMKKTSDEGTIIYSRPLKILKTIITGK